MRRNANEIKLTQLSHRYRNGAPAAAVRVHTDYELRWATRSPGELTVLGYLVEIAFKYSLCRHSSGYTITGVTNCVPFVFQLHLCRGTVCRLFLERILVDERLIHQLDSLHYQNFKKSNMTCCWYFP